MTGSGYCAQIGAALPCLVDPSLHGDSTDWRNNWAMQPTSFLFFEYEGKVTLTVLQRSSPNASVKIQCSPEEESVGIATSLLASLISPVLFQILGSLMILTLRAVYARHQYIVSMWIHPHNLDRRRLSACTIKWSVIVYEFHVTMRLGKHGKSAPFCAQ